MVSKGRMNWLRAVLALCCVLAVTLGGMSAAWAKGGNPMVKLTTSKGDIVIELDKEKAPATTANFLNYVKKGHYDGLIFHRVIPGFMIQGGDPLGSGRGDPGYRFEDEQNGKTFDKPGILAMANAGPNTNGSQFFITTATPSHLNGRHTIFGEVTKGYDVVQKISEVERGPGDRPMQEVKIANISITDTAP